MSDIHRGTGAAIAPSAPSFEAPYNFPDAKGHFGRYGGSEIVE